MVYLRIKACKSNCTPDCTILYSRVFEKYLLAVEPFAKALGVFETCISVNINWYKKFYGSLWKMQNSLFCFFNNKKICCIPWFI